MKNKRRISNYFRFAKRLTDKLDENKAIDDSYLALLDQIESEKEFGDIINRDNKIRLTLTRL